jgi:tripartite-type tricarboxylate transporter receptor subunit TctC
MIKGFLASALCCVLALAAPAKADAATQPFPDGRPVRVLVGYAAGGTVDITARIVSQRLGQELGVPVVVENKPGANGNLAALDVARAAPDGHTLLYTFSGTFTQNPFTQLALPYDPFKDFTPITLAVQGPQILVESVSVPARNLGELIAWGRANPGKLSIASVGYGSSTHVFAETLMRETGIRMIHVPYKGAGDAAKDLLGGTVQLMFDGAPSAVQNAATGRIRMLGVTAARRSALLPDLPTLTEQGVKGIELQGWQGYFGPAHLPEPVVHRLRDAIAKVLAQPAVKEQIGKGLWETVGSTPDALRARIRVDYDQWGAAIKALGIKPQ